MTSVRDVLKRLPENVRQALANELLSMNGTVPDEAPPPSDEAIMAALGALAAEEQQTRRRVVVTGMGAVTPVGNTAQETWEALIEGKSGIGPVTQFDVSPYASRIGAEIKEFDPSIRIPHKEARRMARCSQVSVVAAYEALEDAGLKPDDIDGDRAGVTMGTGVGGMDIFVAAIKRSAGKKKLRGRPMETINGLPNIASFHISNAFGFRGPLNTVVTACAAGTQSIGIALEEIRRGTADIMLAGGVEAMVSDVFYGGFEALRATTTRNDEPTRASRPFDAERDGFVIGEGTAILVLESLENALARGARIYAEVLGWGQSADSYHAAQPDPTGSGGALAMRGALSDAGLSIDDISYINAHAAGTPLGDAHETLVIKEVFGEQAYDIPVSSTKSMIGHCFGGAGAIEAMACIFSVFHDVVHPTVNYENPDPECDLDYVPAVARKTEIKAALSNSFGLGGQNACLIVGKYLP
ncbi:MAG: beta-ketoacyl-ACP synthase II [Chloroflexota bacterium]|nr:beta-ketoacyl-ACP synthase II [Chloroflexota bacterium]